MATNNALSDANIAITTATDALNQLNNLQNEFVNLQKPVPEECQNFYALAAGKAGSDGLSVSNNLKAALETYKVNNTTLSQLNQSIEGLNLDAIQTAYNAGAAININNYPPGTQEQWRQKMDQLKQQLRTALDDARELEAQLETAKNNLTTSVANVNRLTGQLGALNDALRKNITDYNNCLALATTVAQPQSVVSGASTGTSGASTGTSGASTGTTATAAQIQAVISAVAPYAVQVQAAQLSTIVQALKSAQVPTSQIQTIMQSLVASQVPATQIASVVQALIAAQIPATQLSPVQIPTVIQAMVTAQSSATQIKDTVGNLTSATDTTASSGSSGCQCRCVPT